MTTKRELLSEIRKNCIGCSGEKLTGIAECTMELKCPLWPFRMGKDPEPSCVRQGWRLQEGPGRKKPYDAFTLRGWNYDGRPLLPQSCARVSPGGIEVHARCGGSAPKSRQHSQWAGPA